MYERRREDISLAFVGIPNQIYKQQGCEPEGAPGIRGDFYVTKSGPSIQLYPLKCSILLPRWQKFGSRIYLTFVTVYLVISILLILHKTYHGFLNGFSGFFIIRKAKIKLVL